MEVAFLFEQNFLANFSSTILHYIGFSGIMKKIKYLLHIPLLQIE
jgi:hypothetical protein